MSKRNKSWGQTLDILTQCLAKLVLHLLSEEPHWLWGLWGVSPRAVRFVGCLPHRLSVKVSQATPMILQGPLIWLLENWRSEKAGSWLRHVAKMESEPTRFWFNYIILRMPPPCHPCTDPRWQPQRPWPCSAPGPHLNCRHCLRPCIGHKSTLLSWSLFGGWGCWAQSSEGVTEVGSKTSSITMVLPFLSLGHRSWALFTFWQIYAYDFSQRDIKILGHIQSAIKTQGPMLMAL